MSKISEFIEKNGIKQKELAFYLGIGEPSISKMVNGLSNPSKGNLHKLLNNDQGWDTSMLLEQEVPNVSISHSPINVATGQGRINNYGLPPQITPAEPDSEEDLIPVIPTNLYKEADVNIVEYINDEENVVPMSPAVQQFPKTDMFYSVQTMAMYPHLHQGDILALKAVKKKTPIVNGELYAVDSIDLGILVRFIYDRGDRIELKGSEKADRFESFFIDKEDIYNIFRVVGLIRTNI